MNFEKLLAERVFKNYNISRFYSNLLQVCPSVPSLVYAVLYIYLFKFMHHSIPAAFIPPG